MLATAYMMMLPMAWWLAAALMYVVFCSMYSAYLVAFVCMVYIAGCVKSQLLVFEAHGTFRLHACFGAVVLYFEWGLLVWVDVLKLIF